MSTRTKYLLVEKIQSLSPIEQEQVLEFVENLQHKVAKEPTKKSLIGRLANLGINISKEEIDQARKETWNNFPRETSN